ncbi:MAG: cation-translocating P-type ATPase [Gammaproteobacteria bacterium]|nr:cation-translocating P-type ATPase [Gammaproteobacteria bacterium]
MNSQNPQGSAIEVPVELSPALAERYLERQDGSKTQVVLIVSGITCGGCIRKIESELLTLPGLNTVSVNSISHRATVSFSHKILALEDIISKLKGMGYPSWPYEPRQQEVKIESERRQALLRIMVAAALGMQVMMIATALYFGEAYGMNESLRTMLEHVALLLTIPIMLFSARPFFQQAWNNVKNRQAGMDVPVSLALIVAFFGSAWATMGNPGQVYYESIAMFVLLLLCARFLELSARRRSLGTVLNVEKSIPESAMRLVDGQTVKVDVREIEIGDHILVQPGEIIPADGAIAKGQTTVDESLLTGESRPVMKTGGSQVVAGSVNLESPVNILATSSASGFAVNRIMRLAETAQVGKSQTALMADRVASYFIAGVLVLAFISGAAWWVIDPTFWLAVVISTLVVACPCALSLATPTAFVAAMGRLSRQGIVTMKSEFLENICTLDQVVFDKTGTLTMGMFELKSVEVLEGWEELQVLSLAASLDQHSHHPFAKAFRDAAEKHEGFEYLEIEDLVSKTGSGIIGSYLGEEVAIGSSRMIGSLVSCPDGLLGKKPGTGNSVCYLAYGRQAVARFELGDTLRDGAGGVIQELKNRGLDLVMLSGDSSDAVARVAKETGIDNYHAEMSPEEKLDFVRQRIDSERRIIVVGDGINDAPMAALANVSIAMGEASDLTRLNSDAVLLNGRLTEILEVIEVAWRTRRTIRQNMSWALGYNLLAIPCAMFGLIPPWLAAIGMSTSSLIVSGNALRMGRLKSRHRTEIRS